MTGAGGRLGQVYRGLLPVLLLVLMACSQRSPSGDARPESNAWFVEEAAKRGIEFRYQSGFAGRALLPEIVGGGAALADLDGDGDLDIYLVQSGWNLAAGPAANAPGNQLYINRGDGYFDAAKDMGQAGDRGYGMGVAAGDYDNDGDIDLYVTNLGANVLLRNDGTGRFEDQTAVAGVGDPGWSTAAAFADLDRDGDLDLFVVNYLNWSLAIERDCFYRGGPIRCAPTPRPSIGWKYAGPRARYRSSQQPLKSMRRLRFGSLLLQRTITHVSIRLCPWLVAFVELWVGCIEHIDVRTDRLSGIIDFAVDKAG